MYSDDTGINLRPPLLLGNATEAYRNAVAEFSFLSCTTMFAAKIFKYIKEYGIFTTGQFKILVITNLVAFLVAILAIKFFISILKKYGYKA